MAATLPDEMTRPPNETSSGWPLKLPRIAKISQPEDMTMVNRVSRRSALLLGSAAAATAVAGPAAAQSGQPITIGFSMAMTGGLGPNGKSALLAQKIWEENVNAKGGLLGRPVKLVYYDDQSNPSTVPGIFTKLLDVDKVDLVTGDYGTNLLAPAMPIVIQHKMTFFALFGLDVNREFQYPRYF